VSVFVLGCCYPCSILTRYIVGHQNSVNHILKDNGRDAFYVPSPTVSLELLFRLYSVPLNLMFAAHILHGRPGPFRLH